VSKILYVGNLPFTTTASELSRLVKPFGEVISARIGLDKKTHKSRGFGFVEVPDQVAQTVITALNGTKFQGRNLMVNESTPRPTRNNREKAWKSRAEMDFDDLPDE
jgi:RNA recognition motif-containing protein